MFFSQAKVGLEKKHNIINAIHKDWEKKWLLLNFPRKLLNYGREIISKKRGNGALMNDLSFVN